MEVDTIRSLTKFMNYHRDSENEQMLLKMLIDDRSEHISPRSCLMGRYTHFPSIHAEYL